MYRNELKTVLQISILKRIDVADRRLTGLDETSRLTLKKTEENQRLSEDNFRELLEHVRGPKSALARLRHSPVCRQSEGVGGYDLRSPLDHVTTFDYDRSGKDDHLVLYRPGSGALFILKDISNGFTPVFTPEAGGSGIGGYDLRDPRDRVFTFDYNHSGRLDYLALYRPGTGTMWILKNTSGVSSPVYAEGYPGTEIGGYGFASSADRVFAFDYTQIRILDHLALYRPGTGTKWILQNVSGVFSPVYAQGCPGAGIGGYDLRSAAERAFAFDYNSSGKQDHIVLYRQGTGTVWILQNNQGLFSPVYHTEDLGSGNGGYHIRSSLRIGFQS